MSLTFDVDAETGWLGEGPQFANKLSTLSEGRFGPVRGVPRILAILERAHVPATFYVPGRTAEMHPGAVKAIVAGGHEVAHHGYMHLSSEDLSPDAQREEIERGFEALRSLGVAPRGYRSPSWELAPETFALLVESGFAYDSSCMGDDRPYVERHDGLEILELPVHWSLDDWPHFAWHPGTNEMLNPPSGFHETFMGEFESALAEQRHVTYTMHPEVIGRGYRSRILERLIAEMRERASVWFTSHRDLARLLADGDSGSRVG